MKKNKFHIILIFIFSLSLGLISCNKDDDLNNDSEIVEDDTDFEATYWTDATHSKNVDPNYDEVFEDEAVKRIDIVITETRWQSMLDDMTNTYGTFGSGSRGPGGGLIETDEDPTFVPAEVYYDGIQWYRVGVRFKGNSSLQT